MLLHVWFSIFNFLLLSCFRRSLPLNTLTIKCDSTNGATSATSISSQRCHDSQPQHHYSNVCISTSSGTTPSPSSRLLDDSSTNGLFTSTPTSGGGDYYFAVREQIEEIKNLECEDSSTLSDEDCTPHVSRSNSRGNEVVVAKLRYSPAVHSAEAAPSSPSASATSSSSSSSCVVRGRVKRKEERAAHRSRSLPPPPPYRPPPPATSRRAPITSYYLGECSQMQKYVITRTYMDEESYVWRRRTEIPHPRGLIRKSLGNHYFVRIFLRFFLYVRVFFISGNYWPYRCAHISRWPPLIVSPSCTDVSYHNFVSVIIVRCVFSSFFILTSFPHFFII